MQPPEARVFIIEDDPSKLDVLTDFVESNEGLVVGSANNRKEAISALKDSEFPASINNANVVLIDGNLDDRGGRGTDGEIVFSVGYERAALHRTDTADGLGAVAIGSSIDAHSLVAHATGANLLFISDPHATIQESDAQWRELLDPQPAEPLYLPEGTMERKSWPNGWFFVDMAEEVLPVEPNTKEAITVHSLTVRSTKKQDEGDVVVNSTHIADKTKLTVDQLTKQGEFGKDFTDRKIDKHNISGLVQVGEYLYVLRHTTEIRSNAFNRFLFTDGKTDKIAIDKLAEIPDSYWESIGIDRPQI